MRTQFYRPRCVTYRYTPDLHPISVADHEAEGRVTGAAVHLHKLWVPRRVCADKEWDIITFYVLLLQNCIHKWSHPAHCTVFTGMNTKQINMRICYIFNEYVSYNHIIHLFTQHFPIINLVCPVKSFHHFTVKKSSLNSFNSIIAINFVFYFTQTFSKTWISYLCPHFALILPSFISFCYCIIPL